MKDLKSLSNEELLKYYDEMLENEKCEYSMDGSGECGHFIAEAFEPIWNEFRKEFDERNIKISDSFDSEIPY